MYSEMIIFLGILYVLWNDHCFWNIVFTPLYSFSNQFEGCYPVNQFNHTSLVAGRPK